MTELFEQQERAIKAAYAAGLNGTPAAFEGDGVTVVERPEPNWGYVANGATFARGTLVAVAPALVDFARENAPGLHRVATSHDYMGAIRDEARRLGLGESLTVYAGAICWGLSRVPEAVELPAGLKFEAVDGEWLNAAIPSGVFPNGSGPDDGSGGRAFRNKYGLAIRDAAGETLALAGVFDTYGMDEIGVDVVAGRQGEGLGRAVVVAAIHAILERGAVPFYGCSPSNIRSQRTAFSCGFLPVCSDGTVS